MGIPSKEYGVASEELSNGGLIDIFDDGRHMHYRNAS